MLSSSRNNTERCEDQRNEKIKRFDVMSLEDGITYQKSVQIILMSAFQISFQKIYFHIKHFLNKKFSFLKNRLLRQSLKNLIGKLGTFIDL